MLNSPALVNQGHKQGQGGANDRNHSQRWDLNQIGAPAMEPGHRIGARAHDALLLESCWEGPGWKDPGWESGCLASRRVRASPTRYTDPETTIWPFGKFDGLADGFGLHRESSGNAGRGQQIVEGSGAGGMDWREDDLVKNRKEDLCHLRDRFIAQATEDEGARALIGQGIEPGAQGPCPRRIVRHIQNPFDAIPLDVLQARRPTRLVDPIGNRARSN